VQPAVTPRASPPATGSGDAALRERVAAAIEAAAPAASVAFIGADGVTSVVREPKVVRTAASTIKLPLLVEVLRREALGDASLTAPHTIVQGDVVAGTGSLQFQVGKTVLYQELVRLMIVESDNVATNILLDRVSMAAVNATMSELGFPGFRFERRMLDEAARAAGRENRVSAADLAGLLRRLWLRQVVSSEVSERAIRLLDERGRADRDWLGLGLPAPPAARLLHINGTLGGVRNDAGIVVRPDGTAYVLAICQDGLADETRGEAIIADLARRVHAAVTAAP